MQRDRHLRNGLNICRGRLTHREVAEALGIALGVEWSDPDAAIA